MAEWDRTTPWRQGQILSAEAVAVLKLKNAKSPEATVAVVISHDCDLAASPTQEPNVEVIVGRFIDKQDGSLAYGKNPRTLHVSFIQKKGRQWIELPSVGKFAIAKTDLAPFAPRTDLSLDQTGVSILQRWLSARYKRAAFSDAFESCLKGHGLDEQLKNILKPLGEHIRAVLFDVDDDEKKDIGNGSSDTFALTIYVIYTTDSDPETARIAAEKVRDQLKAAFGKELFEPSQQWEGIELCGCDAISDEAISVKQSTLFRQWHLEHLSLRDDPPQHMLES